LTRFFANLAGIPVGFDARRSLFSIRGQMMDIRHAAFLCRKGAHQTTTAISGRAARPLRALAVLAIVLASMVALCAQVLAAEPLAVLHEDNPSDPQKGGRYVGSTVWRTESISPGAGRGPELLLRADVEIPERQMSVRWSLRRNTDKALPASHMIEIIFKLPANSPGGGVAQAPGILMKSKEEARGMPLVGVAATVTNGFFMFALAAGEINVERNAQLLKEREWLDIPFAYTNGARAVLSIEKGEPGERAFAQAFAAWSK
jgi:hypothetical protein